MRRQMTLAAVVVITAWVATVAQTSPLRVFIRAGEKTHGPGQHDYPRFLEDWKKLLTERGAVVDDALRFPTQAELAKTDVMVIYKGDAGTMSPDERALLDAYRKRGGGIVVLHDGMCGDDAKWLATIVGGAKQHGEKNYWAGHLKIHIEDRAHPITQGLSDFAFNDEMFFLLRKAPEMHVLASAPKPDGEVVPQLWTYETSAPGGQPYRAFVSLQGHNYTSFASEPYKTIVLRGIAWAGKRPAGTLTQPSQ
jgi:type 1 glutamine amidotransferase